MAQAAFTIRTAGESTPMAAPGADAGAHGAPPGPPAQPRQGAVAARRHGQHATRDDRGSKLATPAPEPAPMATTKGCCCRAPAVQAGSKASTKTAPTRERQHVLMRARQAVSCPAVRRQKRAVHERGAGG